MKQQSRNGGGANGCALFHVCSGSESSSCQGSAVLHSPWSGGASGGLRMERASMIKHLMGRCESWQGLQDLICCHPSPRCWQGQDLCNWHYQGHSLWQNQSLGLVQYHQSALLLWWWPVLRTCTFVLPAGSRALFWFSSSFCGFPPLTLCLLDYLPVLHKQPFWQLQPLF